MLSQKRTLVSQAARANSLALLLRRSEAAQRFAEARAARLEALCPHVLATRELRLFQWEGGLLRLLGRLALAAEGLRKDLMAGTGFGDSVTATSGLMGDKVRETWDGKGWQTD